MSVRRRGHTRRVFLHRLTFFGGGAILLGGPGCKDRNETTGDAKGARRRGAPPPLVTANQSFTNAEYATLAAACDRILPRDEDPGAVDANVPAYIDRMLTTPELRKMKEEFVAGLNALDRRARAVHGKAFAELEPALQDARIAEFKDKGPGTGEAHFYELLLALTMEGFLGDPSYGGNKDRVGWALVGFRTSEPPAGYDGIKHLHDLSESGGGGGTGGCH